MNKYLDLNRELKKKKKKKKTIEHASDKDTNCSWCVWKSPQSIENRIETVGNRRKNGNHSDYNVVEIG